MDQNNISNEAGIEPDRIQKRIIHLIDEYAERIYAFCDDIYTHGETGFHEVRTAEKFEEFLKELNIPTVSKIALTGVKGTVTGKSSVKGPEIGLISELDGIVCPSHPYVNKQNNVSHSCGHHIQMGAVLGAAIALSDSLVLEQMSGSITFMGIPAEEFIGSAEKERLKNDDGIVFSSSGKSEFIRLGEFDPIQIAITHHVHLTETDCDLLLGNNSTNGFIGKKVIFRGKASHAANAPELGINALNAAIIGLTAASYQKETFKDTDSVKIHSIIKSTDGPVNVVPDYVEVETMVRAKNLRAMKDANYKTNLAFEAGAHALGAQIEIKDTPGYLPVIPKKPIEAMELAARLLIDEVSSSAVDDSAHSGASTDVGDLTHLMPVLNFTSGGFTGSLHSQDFAIEDRYKAYIVPAKIMALTVYHLLRNHAEDAMEVIRSFKPILSKDEYIAYKEGKD